MISTPVQQTATRGRARPGAAATRSHADAVLRFALRAVALLVGVLAMSAGLAAAALAESRELRLVAFALLLAGGVVVVLAALRLRYSPRR